MGRIACFKLLEFQFSGNKTDSKVTLRKSHISREQNIIETYPVKAFSLKVCFAFTPAIYNNKQTKLIILYSTSLLVWPIILLFRIWFSFRFFISLFLLRHMFFKMPCSVTIPLSPPFSVAVSLAHPSFLSLSQHGRTDFSWDGINVSVVNIIPPFSFPFVIFLDSQ